MIDRNKTSIGEAGPERKSTEIVDIMTIKITRTDMMGNVDTLNELRERNVAINWMSLHDTE